MSLKVDPAAPLVPLLKPLAIVPGNHVSEEPVTLCIKEKFLSMRGVSPDALTTRPKLTSRKTSRFSMPPRASRRCRSADPRSRCTTASVGT